jgi:hypothetical protein
MSRRTVGYDDRGEPVDELQEILGQRGFDCGPVDAIFGRRTLEAVLAFQGQHPDLVDDGIVGPKTWARLLAYGGAVLEGDPADIAADELEFQLSPRWVADAIVFHVVSRSGERIPPGWGRYDISVGSESLKMGMGGAVISEQVPMGEVPVGGIGKNHWVGDDPSLTVAAVSLVLADRRCVTEWAERSDAHGHWTFELVSGPSYADGSILYAARNVGGPVAAGDAFDQIDVTNLDTDEGFSVTRTTDQDLATGDTYDADVVLGPLPAGRYRAILILNPLAGKSVHWVDWVVGGGHGGEARMVFSVAPAWVGGAIVYTAFNAGDATAWPGTTADHLLVQGDNGVTWQDRFTSPNEVEPGGSYQGVFTLGGLPPGSYQAWVTLGSGQTQGTGWTV